MSQPGAYLYQRGDVYWGRVRCAGREYRRSLRTTDPREAAKRLQAWRLKIERAEVGNADAPLFKAAVVKWATEVLPQAVKPAVARRYLTSIACLREVMGDLRIDQITGAKISQYVSLRAGVVSNATIRRDLTALSRLMAACCAWGWREDNPVRAYDRSVVLRERRDPITPPAQADFDRVLNAAPAPMARVLRLLDQTGMRAEEAVQLRRQDVDWERQTITLTRTKTNRVRLLAWGTPGGDAAAPLDAGAPDGPLFPSATGEPYGNFASAFGAVMRRVMEAERKANRPFRRFRVHDLRHGFAVRWLRNGGDIYRLSKHLGHTSVRTTEVYLSFLTADEQRFAQTGAQKLKTKPE